LTPSTTFAGDKIGNGGGIWSCSKNNKLQIGYLVDLFEAREEFRYPLITPVGTDPNEIANGVMARIKISWPELYGKVYPHMVEVLANFRVVNEALTEIPDSDPRGRPLPEACEYGSWEYLQIANYKLNGQLLIRRDLWESPNLPALDRAALLWHEAIYRWLRTDYQDDNSSRSRQIVGLVFSTWDIDRVKAEVKKILWANTNPAPQPSPTAPPVQNENFLCVIQNHAVNQIYTGYGATLFLASNNAKYACSNGPTAQACGMIEESSDCVNQAAPENWTCTSTNHANGKMYTAQGRSKLEASARNEATCFGGSSAFACASLDFMDCALQP